MQIFGSIMLLVLGIALLVVGGNLFVDAATWISVKLRIPKFIVGATIVSVATTLPELLVSSFATARGEVDIAVGNAIGSVVANISLILAISIIGIPAVIKRKDLWKKFVIMFAASLILFIVSFIRKEVGIVSGIALSVLFVLFLLENVHSAKKAGAEERAQETAAAAGGTTKDGAAFSIGSGVAKQSKDNAAPSVYTAADEAMRQGGNAREGKAKGMTLKEGLNIVKFIVGIAALIIGADLLVDHGKKLAQLAGVSDGIIAVTIVAIGTSMPEFVTTITALVKKQSSLSVGNILGANILNMTLILPISVFISGGALVTSLQSVYLDFPVGLLVGLIAFLPALIRGKFSRLQGVCLLLAYAAYLTLLIVFFL